LQLNVGNFSYFKLVHNFTVVLEPRHCCSPMYMIQLLFKVDLMFINFRPCLVFATDWEQPIGFQFRGITIVCDDMPASEYHSQIPDKHQ